MTMNMGSQIVEKEFFLIMAITFSITQSANSQIIADHAAVDKYDKIPQHYIDPVYNVRWAGLSSGGPDGSKRWGLDSGDESLTGNRVCMDTYLDAVEQYIQHCADNSYLTKVIFTTGPVDDDGGHVGGTENGIQREIKHDYIRDYVKSDTSRILFDYADILCWNNDGEQNIETWDGGQVSIPVSSLTISSIGGVDEVSTGGAIQFNASVLPSNGIFFLDLERNIIELIHRLDPEGSIIEEIIPEPGISKIRIDMSDSPTGLYYIKLFSEQFYEAKRAIIVR